MAKSLAQLPLAFVPNRGQYDPQVRFAVHGAQSAIFLTDTETVFALPPAQPTSAAGKDAPSAGALRMRLVQGNLRAPAKAAAPLPGKTHFYWGSKPSEKRTNVPQYAQVQQANVYPGVDLVYYGREGRLEYDFVVAPHASTEQIQLEFAGARGLSTNAAGALVVETPAGALVQDKPVVYQQFGNRRQPVAGEYRLCGADRVGFALGDYDPSRPLVIDPTLSYSTYLGGSDTDEAYAIDVDTNGKMYVGGSTYSTNFPGQGSQTGEAFVTKLNAAGSAVTWTVIFGTLARVTDLTLDVAQAPVVTGWANGGVPTTLGCLQPSAAGFTDAFVVRFDINGNVFAGTYLGGTLEEYGNGLSIDPDGHLWVVGETLSTNFPTDTAYQAANGGGFDAFATYMPITLDSIIYSTYLGGSSNDGARSVVGLTGHIGALCGYTNSSAFPTVGSLQSYGGNGDAFVCKLNGILIPAIPANTLTFSTFYGGSGADFANALAKRDGKLFVTGGTESTGLATTGAYQTTKGSLYDAFVVKYTASNTIGYSTYLGGSDYEEGRDIAVDTSENCHVTGYTGSSNFPVLNAVQGTAANFFDAFVTKFNSTGTGLLYSTYLGGDGHDFGNGITTQGGNAFIAGSTMSTNFPTASAYQPTYAGNDAFIAKIVP